MFKPILYFFLLFSTLGYSQSQDTLRTYKPGTTLSIGSLNDSYNGAFASNRDDYRSFGFDLDFNYRNQLMIYSAFNGYTNRSRKDTLAEGRLDELLLLGKYEVFKYHRFSLMPIAGLVFSGDMGAAGFQNSIHKDVGEPSVDLPYDYESVHTNFLFGLQLNHRLALNGFHPLFSIDKSLASGMPSITDMILSWERALCWEEQTVTIFHFLFLINTKIFGQLGLWRRYLLRSRG